MKTKPRMEENKQTRKELKFCSLGEKQFNERGNGQDPPGNQQLRGFAHHYFLPITKKQ